MAKVIRYKKYLCFVAFKANVNKCKDAKLGLYMNHIIYLGLRRFQAAYGLRNQAA